MKTIEKNVIEFNVNDEIMFHEIEWDEVKTNLKGNEAIEVSWFVLVDGVEYNPEFVLPFNIALEMNRKLMNSIPFDNEEFAILYEEFSGGINEMDLIDWDDMMIHLGILQEGYFESYSGNVTAKELWRKYYCS